MPKSYPSLAAYLAGEGRTQEQLAADLGVRQGTLTKWVRGVTMPRPKMAVKIASVTGVSIDSMIRARARKVA